MNFSSNREDNYRVEQAGPLRQLSIIRWRYAATAPKATPLLELRSSSLLVNVLPEVGGKVAQIRDLPSGHDLLVPPQRPYRTVPLDGDWLQHDTSGMDDCFPNVAQGFYPQSPWTSICLPDLGEWTHGAWDVAEAESTTIVLERSGSALPYFAQKTIHLIGERTLEFAYVVENRGESALRYLWSAHPLVHTPDSFQLELPPGPVNYRTFPPDGVVYHWPDFHGVDLSRQWIERGTNLKIFLTGLAEGWCALHLPAHTLRFTFDLESVPILGLWLNNHGFPSGEETFRCIALEPCTSASDLLDDLVPSAYPVILPGERAHWTLRLEILSRDLPHAEQHQR